MKEVNSVKIYCYWWLDKYDEFTRYSKWTEADLIDCHHVSVDLLECRLREILAWEVDDWTDIKTDYREYWQMYGKEFIEKDGGTIRATSEHGKGSTFTFTVRPDLKQHRVVAQPSHSLIP